MKAGCGDAIEAKPAPEPESEPESLVFKGADVEDVGVARLVVRFEVRIVDDVTVVAFLLVLLCVIVWTVVVAAPVVVGAAVKTCVD